MQLKDTLEREESTGGFQPTVDDSFLLNEMESYPGDTSRFFVGLPKDDSAIDESGISEFEPSTEIINNTVITYQNDISLEDEFDLSSIPTGKPSDFGYDDGSPTSSPFNEDDADVGVFDISTLDDFIHSNDQNPTPIVDNTPALEPIRIQLDTPILTEEPPVKKVKPPKLKKPSKPIDRKVVIIFTMLISSMMVTLSILFLLWKQKQAKEELYAIKTTMLHHTSPNGNNSDIDSANHHNSHSDEKTTSHIKDSVSSSYIGNVLDSSKLLTNNKSDTANRSQQTTNHSTNVAHSSSNIKHTTSTNTTNNSQRITNKNSRPNFSKDSDINTPKSNNRSLVSSKSTRAAEYAVKVHSSYSKVDAVLKAEQLRKEGAENVTVSEQKIRDRTIYNVRYGKFSTLNEAEAASRRTTLPSRWIDRTK